MFDWDSFDVVIGGKSALDSKFFTGPMTNTEVVEKFLVEYGLNPRDPVSRAELFGNFQEAIQFIKRYFLKEGNPDGIDLKIPNDIYMITEITDLFLMATGNLPGTTAENAYWAESILKVMHTILHIDKDLRSNYFSTVQTQIFDRFYKHLNRDEAGSLYLGKMDDPNRVPLLDFQTKAKKTRESVIIKLLHKVENVAEELFDRVGIRIVTHKRFDTLRVVKFLVDNYVVIPHNVKPSRSLNSLIDMGELKATHLRAVKVALRENWDEQRFLDEVEKEIMDDRLNHDPDRNQYSLASYQSIQFTGRTLIKYRNPFYQEFSELRKSAKSLQDENELAKKILSLDYSRISRDVRFFYPFEVQIVDNLAHKTNTEGEASHLEYKKSQVQAAMKRVLAPLIRLYNLES